jgi:primary-amine oxidase
MSSVLPRKSRGVMPNTVEYIGFTLKPNGFLAENPAMDLPLDRNAASRDNREHSCCH